MRLILRICIGAVLVLCVTALFALYHPRSPLPDHLHPFRTLAIADPVTLWTKRKLNAALASGEMCAQVLNGGAGFLRMPDLESSEVCHIRDRVELSRIGSAAISPVETRCQTALRLAMWMRHGIQPAARRHFGEEVARLHHSSSYNCRQIRSTRGSSGRMSTHATAEAIDISGVTLTSGRKLSLLDGWPAQDARAAFFVEIRDSACLWFRVTLGPEYNRLHADHFHLQHTGWGLCR